MQIFVISLGGFFRCELILNLDNFHKKEGFITLVTDLKLESVWLEMFMQEIRQTVLCSAKKNYMQTWI